jgi:hypothetical protein
MQGTIDQLETDSSGVGQGSLAKAVHLRERDLVVGAMPDIISLMEIGLEELEPFGKASPWSSPPRLRLSICRPAGARLFVCPVDWRCILSTSVRSVSRRPMAIVPSSGRDLRGSWLCFVASTSRLGVTTG